MRFGIFYEHQLPRPWLQWSEAQLYREALEQIELADRLGIDYVWEVEHHFLEEYSHSSAPEVFLAAASQRTTNIRLGHGIVNVMPQVNHPARVAERLATLDLVSNGRVDYGTGESSSAAELGGFLIEREHKREMWRESLDAITRMLVEEPFAGSDGQWVQMPPRNVVPKAVQRPHPPVWVACSRRETIHEAARNGIGALSFSFVEPEDAARWVREYYELLDSEECVPAGFGVNANVAVVLPMMLAPSEAEAIERGIDGAHFFGYSLGHYYGLSEHVPGRTDVYKEFASNRDQAGFARHIVRPDQAPLGVRLLQEGLGSLRGAIGTPAQVSDLVRRYEEARAVDGADDARLERRFGSRVVQRAMFSAMAAAFEPDAAGGFEGRLVYELDRPATGAPPSCWTIEVLDGRAVARRGAARHPALRIRFPLSDFVRVAAGTIDPAVPLLRDRASFEGDFSLAAKLPEMFGAPSPY